MSEKNDKQSIVSNFCSLNFNDMTFEKLKKYCENYDVIKISFNYISYIIELCYKIINKPLFTGSVNVKLFLAAYLITKYPEKMFFQFNEIEKNLLDVSYKVVHFLHSTSTLLQKDSSSIKDLKNLYYILCTYLKFFKEWNSKDDNMKIVKTKYTLKIFEEKIANVKLEMVDNKYKLELLNKLETEKYKLQNNIFIIPNNKYIITNEEIFYELLFNPNYRIKKVNDIIDNIYYESFWNYIENFFSYELIFKILKNMKLNLDNILQICYIENFLDVNLNYDFFDIDHIKKQLVIQNFDFNDYYNLINNIINVIINVYEKIKDERLIKIKYFWNDIKKNIKIINPIKAICISLKFIDKCFINIDIDINNYKLKNILCNIDIYGINHLKNYIDNKINNGMSLDLPRKLITEVITQQKDLINIKDIKINYNYYPLISLMFINLIANIPNNENIPEFFMFEKNKIKELNIKFHSDVITCIILLQCETIFKTIHDTTKKTNLINNIFFIINQNIPISIQDNIIELIMVEILPFLNNNYELFKRVLEKNINSSENVYKCMVNKFKIYWFNKILNKPYILTNILPNTSSIIDNNISKYVQILDKIIKINININTIQYNNILNDIFKSELGKRKDSPEHNHILNSKFSKYNDK